MSGFNMPPGVSPGDIPGNEPDEPSFIQGMHAFPVERFGMCGMTLRDYFAAKALMGRIAHGFNLGYTPEDIATEAYKIADAMLKARQS